MDVTKPAPPRLRTAVDTHAVRIELASDRKIRTRNKLHYRVNHWPIWIFVFFIAPGPLTFDLFERGFDERLLAWLGMVLLGTGIAGLAGKLPGCEPAPYIIRFTEDRPNPLYRRICYTMAWGEVIAFAALNAGGLLYAIVTGEWRLKQIYEWFYFPIAGTFWVLGALGKLPRVKASTAGEGHERRYFYGSVWAVTIAQPILWFLWKVLPRSTGSDIVKLVIFVRHSRARRQHGAAGAAAPHAPDRAGRAGGVRLACARSFACWRLRRRARCSRSPRRIRFRRPSRSFATPFSSVLSDTGVPGAGLALVRTVGH